MNSIEIEEMLKKILKDPKKSLLASYLQQIKAFNDASITSNLLNSPIITQYMSIVKSKFAALKNLAIHPNHLNLSKEFSNNFIFIVLQFNQQK
jgi:hypothetical protein